MTASASSIADPAPIVAVSDLHVRIATGDGVIEPVRGVSFSVDRGEAIGLVGESGSGKTLTSLSLIGLLPSGRSRVDADAFTIIGRDMRHAGRSAWRQVRGSEIAMVFQEPMTSLNPVMRIGAQLTEAVRANRAVSSAAARQLVLDALRQVDIADPEKVYRLYPHQLSGGMRQRAMIAMAVSCRAKLIIADEPTTALDVSTQAVVLDLLQQVALDHDTALLLVSHDLGVVARMASRVLVMYAGLVVESGTTADLFAHPRHPYTAALLASIPRMADRPGTRFPAIPGSAPSVDRIPPGCPFAPRCGRRTAACEVRPTLGAGGGSGDPPPGRRTEAPQLFACWNPLPVDDPGRAWKASR